MILLIRFAPKNTGTYYEPQVCPLFPHEDVRQKFDDYGQAIDVQHFLHPPSQRDFPLTADSLVGVPPRSIRFPF